MSLRVPKPIVFKGLHRPAHATAVPFEIACTCGASIRGQRQNQAQMAACPTCGTKRFVLPRSPLPDVTISLDQAEMESGRRLAPRIWIVITAAIVVAAISVSVWLSLHAFKTGSINEPPQEPESYEKHLRNGHAAVAQGAWHRAARELNSAIQLATDLEPAERKRLIQQQRQAAILADLLSESPDEIARLSLGLPEPEWQEIFRERYANRSVILDDTIHRDAAGHYHQQLRVDLQGIEMKYDLAALKLLRNLPLNQPYRVLYGVRLSGFRKDAAGWTILLDADSGVLMTDESMLSGLSIPIDADLREVLKRQESWLTNLP